MNTVTNLGGTIMNNTTNINTAALLTTAEIAARLGKHVITVRLALSDQALHGSKTGGRWLVERDCAEAWARGEKCDHVTRAYLGSLQAAARNTPCKYAACDGGGHEYNVPESDWSHEAVSEYFDGRTIFASISIINGEAAGYMEYEATDGMTAAEFRAEADTYEAYPAWLRSMADRMDALDAKRAATSEFPAVDAWFDSHADIGAVPVADVMMAGFSEPETKALFARFAAEQGPLSA